MTIKTPHTPDELIDLVKAGLLKAVRFENLAGELVTSIEFFPTLERIDLGQEKRFSSRAARIQRREFEK